jgi:hypothetical protein
MTEDLGFGGVQWRCNYYSATLLKLGIFVVGARGVEGVPCRCGGSGEAGRRRALAAPSRPPRHPLCGIYWFFSPPQKCVSLTSSAAVIFMCLCPCLCSATVFAFVCVSTVVVFRAFLLFSWSNQYKKKIFFRRSKRHRNFPPFFFAS